MARTAMVGQKSPRAKKIKATKQQEIPASDPLLTGMNPEQAQAIIHMQGPLGVFAGAGSGKTRVIIHRVAHLIRQGVAPSSILAVTFSKAAAEEMKERGKRLGLDAEFRTWHSLALHIIREDETKWKAWRIDGDAAPDKDGIAPSARAEYILKDAVGYKGMNWAKADCNKLKSFIGFCKSQLWKPTDEQALEYAQDLFEGEALLAVEAYERYEEGLNAAQILTFDDMLVHCHTWLCRPGMAEKWAAQWEYVLQDEAQDANPAQLAIAKLLAYGHKNYCVVGDPAQSIYAFRGSKPSFLLTFGTDWDAKVINMNRNYRCGRRIIDVANAVIRPSQHRLPVDIVAEGDWDGDVRWEQCATLEDEATQVATTIETAHKDREHRYSDHVVLYRLNAQSRAVEEALLAHHIPYVVVGGTSFYERKEVKDLLSYLRLIVGKQVKESIKRALNAPFRFLGRAYLEKVIACMRGTSLQAATEAVMAACSLANVQGRQRASAQQFCRLLTACAAMGGKPSDVLQHIVDETQYCEWLKKDSGEENLECSHVANVKELVRVAERFTTVQELVEFVDGTIAQSKENKEASKQGDRVVLMTVHKSKGLEFRAVHIVGAVEQIMPHPRNEDSDEERRLFYVACTRAKEELHITSPRYIATRLGTIEVEPSRFVCEAGLVE